MFPILHGAAKFEYGGKSDLDAPDPRNGIIMTFPSKVDKPHGIRIHCFFLLQNICSEIAVKDEAAFGAYSFLAILAMLM